MTRTAELIRKTKGGVAPSFPRSKGLYESESEWERLLADTRIGGGDGNVSATHDGGGKVLKGTRLELIYWGSAWTKPTTTPSAADYTRAINDIVNGPWGAKLNQYRGAGVASVENVETHSSSDPPTSFTDADVWGLIDSRISAGTSPAPSSDVDRIYCVIMPTGHASGDTSFVGQHQYTDRNGVRVFWAWVTNDGTLNGSNSVTKILTHEVAEACTDSDVSTGITVTSPEGDEIGDVCNNTVSVINGEAQEAYWSKDDNRCVLPTDVLRVTRKSAVARAADGRIEIFVRAADNQTDNHVWHLYQTAPNGDWSGWEDLSAYRPLPGGLLTVIGDPAAGNAADGRIEIFARGVDNHVWHLYQTTPNGDWSAWEDLSAYRPIPGGALAVVGDPAAGCAADGRIEIFARGVDNHVWHLYQTAPNGDWSDWEDLSAYRPLPDGGLLTVIGGPAAGRAADGRIEIFARGVDNHVWHLYQTAPNGDWSAWEDLSTYRPLPAGLVTVVGAPAAGSAADGRIEIFARGVDNHVWHLYQTAPNGDWSAWEDLSTYRPLPSGLLSVIGDPAASRAADGRIEIFARGVDNHVWHLYQTAPNGDWSAWEDLSAYRPLPGGTLTAVSDPAAGSAADGRIEIFLPDVHNHLRRLRQTEPNGDWQEWEDLSNYKPITF